MNRPASRDLKSQISNLSPRRRRLRHTLQVLGTLAVAGGLAVAILAIIRRPPPYEPGEVSADVTSELSKNLPPDAPKPRLTDVTAEAGLGAFRTFGGARTSQLPEDNGPGLAFADFDNDGDDDVFLVSAGGALNLDLGQLAPCELHENLGQGRFQKAPGFPATRIRGMGAAWADYDGDGFLDLAVSGYNALLLFHNEAEGTGRRLAPAPGFPNLPGYWAGVAWGDYDRDRDPDLYVCGYVQYKEESGLAGRVSEQVGVSVPYTLNPSSYEPGLNLLFRNNGDGTFTEVARELGVTNPTGRSLGAVWHDFDDDGWLDLYVANDVSDNVLYHNEQGRFVDMSHPALVADYRSAMGLAVGDYDRDGDDDLFVAHWVAQENALYQNLWADLNGPARQAGGSASPAGSSPGTAATTSQADHPLPHAQPGLARGDGIPSATTPAGPGHRGFARDPATGHFPLRFLDVADMKGLGQIALPCVGWGSEFVDLDQDGWLDLLVANGNTIEEEGPAPRKLKPQEPFLFWNQRGSFFHNLAPFAPALSQPHVSRGLAVSDYDDDGDMDILVAHLGEGVQLLRNDMAAGHWLKLRLRSRAPDGRATGFGDGARVFVSAGGTSHRRCVTGGSYLSQSSRTLHFGLGGVARVERVEVRWLGGGTNVCQNLDGDTVWEITEGEALPQRFVRRRNPATGLHPTSALTNANPANERSRLVAFWDVQRAAMNAVKVENDHAKAVGLFRSALALNPGHEDSHYYLAQSLASLNDAEGAIEELRTLTRLNPQSHRAYQAWGSLRAVFARNEADLAEAAQALNRARAINPEETGALAVLAEVCLLQGLLPEANGHLETVCRTNPRAAESWFLRGFVAWKKGDEPSARQFLVESRNALGKEWQPKGTTAEGDVKRKQHAEKTPLNRFFAAWSGTLEPGTAFAELDRHLADAPR